MLKSLDASGSYKTLCADIKDLLLTIASSYTQVAHGRDLPDGVMGISDMHAEAPEPPILEIQDGSAGHLDALRRGKGKANAGGKLQQQTP